MSDDQRRRSAADALVEGLPTRSTIDEAAARIDGYVRETPVVDLEPGVFGVPGRLSLKLELIQHSGSFKARGAFNLLLARDVPPAGVVAASGGNFGLAIAYAARQLGHPATIFVPEVTVAAKRDKLSALGARVVVTGQVYADALSASLTEVENTGALFAHAYDQPEVVAGGGVCARELVTQRPSLDTVLVSVGGGGLIGGFACWYAGDTRIVAVEPEQAPTLARALAAGAPVDVEVSGVAADSLGASRIGALGFAAARRWVERSVLVTDDDIRRAQWLLWDTARVLCEPGSAAPLAALLAGAYIPAVDERVCLLICGANLDPASLTPPI